MVIGCRLACGNERWIANGLVSWAFVSAIVGVGLSRSRSSEPSLNCPLRTGKYFHLMAGRYSLFEEKRRPVQTVKRSVLCGGGGYTIVGACRHWFLRER